MLLVFKPILIFLSVGTLILIVSGCKEITGPDYWGRPFASNEGGFTSKALGDDEKCAVVAVTNSVYVLEYRPIDGWTGDDAELTGRYTKDLSNLNLISMETTQRQNSGSFLTAGKTLELEGDFPFSSTSYFTIPWLGSGFSATPDIVSFSGVMFGYLKHFPYTKNGEQSFSRLSIFEFTHPGENPEWLTGAGNIPNEGKFTAGKCGTLYLVNLTSYPGTEEVVVASPTVQAIDLVGTDASKLSSKEITRRLETAAVMFEQMRETVGQIVTEVAPKYLENDGKISLLESAAIAINVESDRRYRRLKINQSNEVFADQLREKSKAHFINISKSLAPN